MTATTEKFAIAPSPSTTDAPLQDPSLQQIVRSLPKACFEKNRWKAWLSVLLSVAAVALGYLGIVALPWFFLPLTWLWTGTALTGFFVVAHDCGHRSFAKRRWVNDLVGHALMLPLIYPFHCWRILHNHHHLHTNKLNVDNAWEPWETQDFREKSAVIQWFYRGIRGWFWWIGSIAHWGKLHFDLNQFAERDRPKVKFSITLVAIFAALFFPTLLWTTGLWGFVKFWLMPWLFYHFWMSTFTLVHHTDADIHFHPEAQWSAGVAQLFGTVHCTYPRWVEVLCHDINVHIPHHVSVAIPSYNLRMAHQLLEEQWGDRLQKRQFSWSLMQSIVNHCHLYHPQNAYQPFKSLGQ